MDVLLHIESRQCIYVTRQLLLEEQSKTCFSLKIFSISKKTTNSVSMTEVPTGTRNNFEMTIEVKKKTEMSLETMQFNEPCCPSNATANCKKVKFSMKTKIFFLKLREWFKEKKAKIKEKIYRITAPGLYKIKRNNSEVGKSIRAYALQLAMDKSTTFSQNIENFIQCTKESKESSPHVVMRNMRQFMSGMKNYLVKHGEREFEKEVEKERLMLKDNEFLNLDYILEDVMMHLVVKPLREHVYKLFIDYYINDGSLKMLAEGIQYAQPKTMYDFGVRETILPPVEANIERIKNTIQVLQCADSPLEKLDHLLVAIAAVYKTARMVNTNKIALMGADDLLPLILWILTRCKFVDAEIESEFMWGLLHPSQVSGEGGYYLTTLSSAVQILKNLKSSEGTISTINGCGTPDCSSILRVLVPDELHGSLNTRTLPVRPNMNTRDICRILAHKIRCTNPQDYGLFKLVQGEETLLSDQECPQELSHCLFAYKRIDAKIAWPKSANPTTPTLSSSSSNGIHS